MIINLDNKTKMEKIKELLEAELLVTQVSKLQLEMGILDMDGVRNNLQAFDNFAIVEMSKP